MYYLSSMRGISVNKELCVAATVLIATVMMFLVHCSRPQERIDFTKSLPPRLATLLLEGEDSTLALYARDAGFETIIDAHRHLDSLIQGMPAQDYFLHADSIHTIMKRVCIVLADEYDCDFYLNDLEFLDGFPPLKRQQIMKMRTKVWDKLFDTHLAHEARIDSVIGYYNILAELDDRYGVGTARMALSEMYGAIGNRKNEKRYLIEAGKDFSELGMHRMHCQSLGVLGTIYEREGKVDSMEMCYKKARDLAIRYELSDQISRFSYFYARRYARMGRLALANDLFNEAIELCKSHKGGYYEIRFIFHAMEFYADYSCWETVERLLSRARILEKVYANTRYSKQYVVSNVFMEARLQMARGNVEKANSLFREIEKSVFADPQLVDPNYYFYYWARGLLESGLAEDAIEIIDRGLSYARPKSLAREEIKFLTLKASAEFMRGNTEEARKAIERFDALSAKLKNPLLYDWVTRYVICARIAIAEDNTTEALACVEEGLGRLRSFVGLMDVTVQGYLWINECIELRRLMHELTAHDPKLGYGAELFWRGIVLDMGTKHADPNASYALAMEAIIGSDMAATPQSDGNLIDYFGVLAERAISGIRELDAVHCMYVVDDNHITRFTVSPDDVQRDAIPVPRDELRSLVIETQECMSGERGPSGSADSEDMYNNLSRLGKYLLPDDLGSYIRPGDPRTLMITTDDFLSRIPFETFNISTEGEYVPLLEHFDVAYLRCLETKNASPGSESPGMIVVNSSSGNLLRNRSSFSHRLLCVKAEGQAIAALDENAILLQGREATKQEIKERWEEASYLYFATHIIRDPEIPYLVLIPLPAPDGAISPESGFLDFTDIRSADFSRCDFVVLSGCSSGVPSVATRNIGPSLGDAFLDAGAAVVIATFWDVKDEEARKLMTHYAGELEMSGHAHIRSLCDARRTLLKEDPGSRQSFDWASYAIHVGRVPKR